MEANVKGRLGTQNYKVELKTATNSLIADEPHVAGGQDLGFNPFELLSAALAACTSATVRMYADRKGWILKEIKVDIHAVKEDGSPNAQLKRTIELTGTLDDKQRERLLKVAEACPIHKILSQPSEITTELK